jgi:8-oxo-dGTP pyrophosphatase MutT (NUDIX family)
MKAPKKASPEIPKFQYAALPWRRDKELWVMLVSSRETRRWVLPKGWPMKGRKPHAAAAREALEEAGIEGKIDKESIGDYHYVKRMKNGATQSCEVSVFPLKVLNERKSWPEKAERIRKWFRLVEAANAVDEPELRDLILAFANADR